MRRHHGWSIRSVLGRHHESQPALTHSSQDPGDNISVPPHRSSSRFGPEEVSRPRNVFPKQVVYLEPLPSPTAPQLFANPAKNNSHAHQQQPLMYNCSFVSGGGAHRSAI